MCTFITLHGQKEKYHTLTCKDEGRGCYKINFTTVWYTCTSGTCILLSSRDWGVSLSVAASPACNKDLWEVS